MNEEFDKWWDSPEIRHSTNPYKADTAVYWSYEAWMWSAKAEREACARIAELVAREIDDTNGTATYIAAAIRARGDA
jgi:hypothetical protein